MKSILISGAGIAGPTLAYWLLERGMKPTIVEQAPHLRVGGYVVDFWGVGYDVAEKMRLLPELQRTGYDIEELRIVDREGRRVGGFGVEVFRELTGGRYVSIARSELAKLLFDSIVGRCETLFGDSIATLSQSDGGLEVTFERAPPRRFDLVIGADGLHSQVRRLTLGPEENFETYLGYMVAAFQTKGYRPRDELTYVSHAVPGKQIARLSLHGDRTMFLLIFAADEPLRIDPHDLAAQKAVLQAKFRDAGWESPQILRALEGCDDLYFDRVSQIRMPRWSEGRVALVGDAAYCISLLGGQGSALAMAGAYALAGELGRSGASPASAFGRYEALLRPLLVSKQKAAAQFTGAFAPKTELGLFIRNQVTRMMSVPFVAKLALGASLFDKLELPDYPARAA